MNQPAAMVMEPPFLRENWKKVLASATKESYRYVRVLNGVASVTNGHVLLRSPLQMADGFYHISTQNELFPATPFGYLSYPDFEQVRPPFAKMTPFCEIRCNAPVNSTLTLIDAMSALCQTAKRVLANIVIDKQGMFWQQNTNEFLSFPFNTPSEVVLNAGSLALVLDDLRRYDVVYLSREDRSDFSEMPLVFGLDWARCALIHTLPGTR